jgi:hypothetical protein
MITSAASDFSFVPTLFLFAAEQLIDFGLTVLQDCSTLTTTRTIVEILAQWFGRIRLLPKTTVVVPGVPTKFRKFRVVEFISHVLATLKTMNDESFELLARLVVQLISSKDSASVLLETVFESDDNSLKERLLVSFLASQTHAVTRFLVRRCGFAYWHFTHTRQLRGVNELPFLQPVVRTAFNEHFWGPGQDPLAEFLQAAAKLIVPPLQYSLIFVEHSAALLDSLLARLGIGAVDPAYLWLSDPPSARLILASALEALRRFPAVLEAWQTEAFRWAFGCSNVETAYRSLFIFNALGGRITVDLIPVIADAVAWHLTKASAPDASRFVGEVLELLNSHISFEACAEFATKFAAIVLGAHYFEPNCLRRTLPIFIARNDARGRALVDAFVPFLVGLETDPHAQQRMVDIINATDSPPLLLVAAAVLRNPIPFADLHRTYSEIMSAPITAAEATDGIRLFGRLIQTASRQLCESMLAIATDLLTKFELSMDWGAVGPIYRAAKQGLAYLKTAPQLLELLIRLDPGTTMDSVEAVKPNTEAIAGEIAKLVSKNVETVSFTKCKQLTQLRGLIKDTQGNIFPFVTLHEMYQTLKRGGAKSERRGLIRRTSTNIRSSLAISIVAPNASSTGAGAFQTLELKPIGCGAIQLAHLGIDEKSIAASKFLLPVAEFARLSSNSGKIAT